MNEIKIRLQKKMIKIYNLASAAFTEFELPSCRKPEQINSVDKEILIKVLSENPADSVIYVAENEIPPGFIHLKIAKAQ